VLTVGLADVNRVVTPLDGAGARSLLGLPCGRLGGPLGPEASELGDEVLDRLRRDE